MPANLKIKTKIRINGKEYGSAGEMPPEVRSVYEKAMADRQTSSGSRVSSHATITFNGQTFSSLEEMPAEVRSI